MVTAGADWFACGVSPRHNETAKISSAPTEIVLVIEFIAAPGLSFAPHNEEQEITPKLQANPVTAGAGRTLLSR
jgi:hypothetical protein